MPWLFFFFFAIELAAFIEFGGEIGFFWTLIEIFVSAFLGFQLLRAQGFAFLWKMRTRPLHFLDQETISLEILRAVGAVLLIIPGFVSDGIGLAFCLPIVNSLMLSLLARFVSPRYAVRTAQHDTTDNAHAETRARMRRDGATIYEGTARETRD